MPNTSAAFVTSIPSLGVTSFVPAQPRCLNFAPWRSAKVSTCPLAIEMVQGGQNKKKGGGKGAGTQPKKSKEDVIEVEGVVVEALPNAMFKVQLENEIEILAHISGKIRKNFIKVIQGDKVVVEMSPYDLTKGRITYRTK